MIIKNLRCEEIDRRPTLLADMVFEDCRYPTKTIHYQTSREFEDGFGLHPEVFFLAGVLPAMRGGEKRIRMDAAVDPVLLEGAAVAIQSLIGWYGGKRALPAFEVEVSPQAEGADARRAGIFLSGGVDSTATLRHNRLLYPATHPASFKDAFFIYGSADIGVGHRDERHIYERGYANLQEVAAETGLKIIPVYTNVRDLALLFPLDFYVLEYHSCMLASVAHAFSRRLGMVTINSAYDVTNLKPFGTHPLLDPNYSSHNLRIRHGSANISRKERVALVGDWTFGLDRLRTCLGHDDALLNCGTCWKCLMTQAELLAVGKLAQSKAFPRDDLSEADLRAHSLNFELERESYLDLIADFDAIGRPELARAARHLVKRYDRAKRPSLKETLQRVDRRYLGSRMRQIKRALLN